MKTVLIFILGILIGIGISFFGYSYLHGNKYATLNQDYKLANGGILKKGTKIKYNTSFPEGFEQYTLYLNMPVWTDNKITIEKENFAVIPHWIEPVSKDSKVDNKLIGEWGIYVTIFGDSNAYCNACPKIEFKENNTAILTLPTNDKEWSLSEYYNWSLNETKLSITPQNNGDSDNYFDSFEYEIEINDKEEFIEFRMLKSERSGYILRK